MRPSDSRDAVVRAVTERPGTRAQLAARTGVPERTVARRLRELVTDGVLVAWMGSDVRRARVFGVPRDRPPGAAIDTDDAIVRAARTQGTIAELAARTGISDATIREHMPALIKAGLLRRARNRYRAV